MEKDKKRILIFLLFFVSSFSEKDWYFMVCPVAEFLEALLFLFGSEASQRQKCSTAAIMQIVTKLGHVGKDEGWHCR